MTTRTSRDAVCGAQAMRTWHKLRSPPPMLIDHSLVARAEFADADNAASLEQEEEEEEEEEDDMVEGVDASARHGCGWCHE
jgi:hypothetical protein